MLNVKNSQSINKFSVQKNKNTKKVSSRERTQHCEDIMCLFAEFLEEFFLFNFNYFVNIPKMS